MATRSVHWHPRLRPKRLWPSGRPMNVTTANSIVMPIGTEKEIKVSDVMKYASICQPMLDAESRAESPRKTRARTLM